MTDQTQRVNIPAVWPPTDLRPVAVNQVLVQYGPPVGPTGRPDGFYLVFGQLAPPIIVPGASQAQIDELVAEPLKVSTEAYLFLTRERLVAMVESIGNMLELIGEDDDADA